MESKRFAKNDSGFICRNCGATVEPLGTSSRDHCPFCLRSIHIDNFPGDRQNSCLGILDPVKAIPDPKKGYILVYRCRSCGEIKRNRAAHDARIQPDDIDKIIALTAAEIENI